MFSSPRGVSFLFPESRLAAFIQALPGPRRAVPASRSRQVFPKKSPRSPRKRPGSRDGICPACFPVRGVQTSCPQKAASRPSSRRCLVCGGQCPLPGRGRFFRRNPLAARANGPAPVMGYARLVFQSAGYKLPVPRKPPRDLHPGVAWSAVIIPYLFAPLQIHCGKGVDFHPFFVPA